jgi:hypothetical protein
VRRKTLVVGDSPADAMLVQRAFGRAKLGSELYFCQESYATPIGAWTPIRPSSFREFCGGNSPHNSAHGNGEWHHNRCDYCNPVTIWRR